MAPEEGSERSFLARSYERHFNERPYLRHTCYLFVTKTTPERMRQKALDLLAKWNGEMNEHLPEPLIYQAWMRAVQDRLIRDDIGPMADEFPHIEPDFLERVFRNIDGAQAWCDVIQSAAVESCTDIARLALDEALVLLARQAGAELYIGSSNFAGVYGNPVQLTGRQVQAQHGMRIGFGDPQLAGGK